jgi:putative tricarboxylic transport membrane protein
METVLHEAAVALAVLFTPLRMAFLFGGVLLGLVFGLIPGLGGIVGLSLLLPFTFNMDTYSAMALLMGLAAAVSHGDVIPAVLFGVPGTVGCAATVMDGFPMAKRGEAGRALGAAFSSSLLGGLFGALLLALAIPVIRPVILFFGSAQLLAVCIFGMTLVASLSGNAPLKGLVSACIGLLISMIGEDKQAGTLRFTFDTLYLWSGMPIVPIALGLFAVPELCDLMINRTSVTGKARVDVMSGQWQGWKDTFNSWFLTLRSSALGAVCAMVPGLGAPVIDWIAYGHAIKTEKGAAETFGKGDVRGVIAAESSTNAREGGALVTTIAFGIPGSPSMAILLGAFLIQGIVPGPEMLTKHLDVTYTIVWSLTLANVLGTLICFMFANQLARVATVRYTILLPIVMMLVYVGAFEGQHSWGDIVSFLLFGTFAWLMKRCGWPRPPLILGFILGGLIERYTFISFERYGWGWLTNWFVILMFALSALSILQRFFKKPNRGTPRPRWSFPRPDSLLRPALALGVLALFVGSLFVEASWPFEARLVPRLISYAGVIFGLILFTTETFLRSPPRGSPSVILGGGADNNPMDGHPGYGDLADREIYRRAGAFFLWTYSVLLAGYLIGFLPALYISTLAFMRLHGKESWRNTLVVSTAMIVFMWLVFDVIVHEPWPPTVLGDAFPVLRTLVPWF